MRASGQRLEAVNVFGEVEVAQGAQVLVLIIELFEAVAHLSVTEYSSRQHTAKRGNESADPQQPWEY